ncbi:MAG: hypothetical protein WD342_08320 [Verrucomicrobiales bacterium]
MNPLLRSGRPIRSLFVCLALLAFPEGTRVFNKTGSTAMCCGDMGTLVAKHRNGGSCPYIVVGIIDSARRSPSYGTWISQRADVIREVSNLAYLAMKQRHSL